MHIAAPRWSRPVRVRHGLPGFRTGSTAPPPSRNPPAAARLRAPTAHHRQIARGSNRRGTRGIRRDRSRRRRPRRPRRPAPVCAGGVATMAGARRKFSNRHAAHFACMRRSKDRKAQTRPAQHECAELGRGARPAGGNCYERDAVRITLGAGATGGSRPIAVPSGTARGVADVHLLTCGYRAPCPLPMRREESLA